MDIKDDKFASYKLLAEPLKKLRYRVIIKKNNNDRTIVTFRSLSGAVWETPAAQIKYPINSEKAKKYSINKDLAYGLAKKEGVPIPFTLLAGAGISDEKLTNMLEKHLPLVVKPTNSSLARGVSLDIYSLPELKKAIAQARLISKSVLVQEQVKGEEIRIVILEGKAIGVLLRRTARVKGDGVSTIAKLIERENELRLNLRLEKVSYPMLDERIVTKSLLKSKFVPANGEVMELGKSTMIRHGCSVYNITGQIHEGYIKIAEKLFKKLKAGFLVVDMFCEDFSQPPNSKNYHFLEFNTAPVLKLFCGCRDGKQLDVIPLLVKSIDSALNKDKQPYGK